MYVRSILRAWSNSSYQIHLIVSKGFSVLANSGGELRVLATRLLPSPLTTDTVNGFYATITECSRQVTTNASMATSIHSVTDSTQTGPSDESILHYLPKSAFHKCPSLKNMTEKHIHDLKRSKWPFQVSWKDRDFLKRD